MDLYLNLPYPLKVIAVTAFGMVAYLKRRTGCYRAFRSELVQHQTLSASALSKLSHEMLTSSYRKAISNVVAYRDYPGDADEELDKIFATLPILDKKDLKSNPEAFRRQDAAISETASTTGSTGSPLEIPCTAESRQKNYAFFDEFLAMHGARKRSKRVTIAGRKLIKSSSKSAPYWVYDGFNRNLYMSAYHLSEHTAAEYLNKLNRFKPVYIDAYPSVVYELALHAQRLGLSMHTPEFICTSSETLMSHQRSAIEQVFGCPVRDQYGSAEMCVFAYECPAGAMHLRTDYSYVEVVDDLGQSVLPGQSGRLICTTFLNDAYPLVRYSIGDSAAIDEAHHCRCGSGFPVMMSLEGRKDDALVSESGRKFTRLSPVLKGFPILESQFEQQDLGSVHLRIVPSAEFSEQDRQRVVTTVNDYLGGEFNISLSVEATIPRGPGGKFRSVIGYKEHRSHLEEYPLAGELQAD